MATKYSGRTLTVTLDAEPSAFPQLVEFGAFGSSRALIDASVYGEDWTSFVTGLQDGDEIAFRIAYDPADTSHQALITVYEDTDGTCTFTVEHSASLFTATISCIITALRRSSPKDGLFELSGTAKIVNPGVVFIES